MMDTEDSDWKDMDFGMDFSDEQHPHDTVYSPVHVSIDPSTFVSLIQNAQVIKSGTWDEIGNWITDNWSDLNGQYQIAANGAVLHQFTLAS